MKGRTVYARGWCAKGEVRSMIGSLPCGAAAWLETDADQLVLFDSMTFKESRDVA